MDNVIVYYEAWQMQCCGTPFAKGDVVSWLVFLGNDSLDINGQKIKIDFYEDHHYRSFGDGMFKLTGQVEHIWAEYSLVKDDDNKVLAYDKVRKYYLDCDEEVDGYNFPEDGHGWAYVIKLSNVKLELLKKEKLED
jgi:hypothetical protein